MIIEEREEVLKWEFAVENNISVEIPLSKELATACGIVEELLHQVSWSDSPPTNEELAVLKHKKKNKKKLGVSPTSSSQCPSAQSLLASPAAATWNSTFSIRSKDQTLGHANMATLCAATLESVGKSPPSFSYTPSPTLEKQQRNSFSSSIKTKLKKLSPSNSNNQKQQEHFFAEARQDSEDSRQQLPAQLQQFGSEYARYLSQTALAPTVEKKKKPTISKIHSSSSSNLNRTLETADASILTGAITDMLVVSENTSPPKGYYKISRTSCDTTEFALYKKQSKFGLWIKKEASWDRACQRPCVTCITMINPSHQEFIPPGFSVVQVVHGDRTQQAFNFSNDPKHPIMLCYRRSREGNPITGLVPLSSKKGETVPEGYTVLEKTPRNHVATFGGGYFLAIRQRLANLESLRPLPLLLANDDSDKNYYYATGSTVIPSKIGRFHILDRTTHSLLSPKSVANRLALVKASRTKSTSSDELTPTYQYSSKLSTSSKEDNVFFGREDSFIVNASFASANSKSLEALNFIPMVECPSTLHSIRADDTFMHRISLLTPILTACYTRHGQACWIALQGLIVLLQDGFFLLDVHVARNSLTRLTLLDLAIQVVCDVATSSCQEILLPSCQEFVSKAIHQARGQVNTRTSGYVLRFHLFCFYFQVTLSQQLSNNTSTLTSSLKELIVFQIARLRSLVLSDFNQYETTTPPSTENDNVPHAVFFNNFMDQLLDQAVDNSVYRVESANYTQLAMYQIQRAGGSELFWYDMMTTCGTQGLFANDFVLKKETLAQYSICFCFLANITKVACATVRRNAATGKAVYRDSCAKLMSLELLEWFLKEWQLAKDFLNVHETSRALDTYLYAIRRLVVPCLIASNTQESLHNPNIFRQVLRIIGTLLKHYKASLKLELGILLEHFCLRFLKLGPQIKNQTNGHQEVYLFAQQLEIMIQLEEWFADSPIVILELFLNLDDDVGEGNDGLPQSSLCQQLLGSLCDIAEQCGEFLAKISNDSIASNIGVGGNMTLARTSAQRLYRAALKTITQIVTSLAKSAATSENNKFQALIDSWIGSSSGKEYMYGEANDADAFQELVAASSSESLESPTGSNSPKTNKEEGENSSQKANILPSVKSPSVIRYWKKKTANSKEKGEGKHQFVDEEKTVEPVFKPVSSEASKAEPSISVSSEEASNKDGTTLISTNSEKQNHLLVAFTIAAEKNISKALDYSVACNIVSPNPREIASFLRVHRTEFKPLALGKYLGYEGGPANKKFFNLIRFSFIRAISFVGMNVEQGLRHLLTNGGFHLPGEAQQIDRIITTFSECYWEDNAGDPYQCPFRDQDTVFMLSFAIIMLNTDLHKNNAPPVACQFSKKMTKSEFIINLRGALKSEEVNTRYLASVYESIAARPIIIHDEDLSSDREFAVTTEFLLNHAKSADSLLRGLAIHEYRFATLDNNSNGAIRVLTQKLFQKTWHQFHGLINSALLMAHMETKGLELSVDILKFSLFLTICLGGFSIEQSAFMNQLRRILRFQQASNMIGIDQQEDLIQIAPNYLETKDQDVKIEYLENIDKLVRGLAFVPTTVDNVEERLAMRDAVAQLKHGEFLLNYPSRRYIREADLIKQANATGVHHKHRFFLFSDRLLYAKKSESKNSTVFKIHGQLSLMSMRIIDWFPPETKYGRRAFQVFHPRKKIVVICSDEEEKRSWVLSLRTAIEEELQRNVSMEAARAAAASV